MLSGQFMSTGLGGGAPNYLSLFKFVSLTLPRGLTIARWP